LRYCVSSGVSCNESITTASTENHPRVNEASTSRHREDRENRRLHANLVCYDVLCYAMSCCVVLCYVMLCQAMLCCVVARCVLLYVMLCYAMLYVLIFLMLFDVMWWRFGVQGVWCSGSAAESLAARRALLPPPHRAIHGRMKLARGQDELSCRNVVLRLFVPPIGHFGGGGLSVDIPSCRMSRVDPVTSPIFPYSGRDCTESLRSCLTGLYTQRLSWRNSLLHGAFHSGSPPLNLALLNEIGACHTRVLVTLLFWIASSDSHGLVNMTRLDVNFYGVWCKFTNCWSKNDLSDRVRATISAKNMFDGGPRITSSLSQVLAPLETLAD